MWRWWRWRIVEAQSPSVAAQNVTAAKGRSLASVCDRSRPTSNFVTQLATLKAAAGRPASARGPTAPRDITCVILPAQIPPWRRRRWRRVVVAVAAVWCAGEDRDARPGAVRGPAGGLHRADARHGQDEIATGKQPELCAEEAGAVWGTDGSVARERQGGRLNSSKSSPRCCWNC